MSKQEIVVYDDIHAVVRKHLKQALGIPVHVVREPNPRPPQFAMITPSGGADRSVVHADRAFILDIWAESEQAAYQMAELAQAYLRILKGVREGITIYGFKPAGGIVWMPDPDAQIPRFRQNWVATFRGNPQTVF